MNDSGRPLSPHLSVYRWPITMTLSILHRMTGAALSIGLLALALWLLSAASGRDAYNEVNGVLQTGIGYLLLVACSFAFFFHLSNGIRHLFWDGGLGFDKRQANVSSWFVIATTIILTLAFWLIIAGSYDEFTIAVEPRTRIRIRQSRHRPLVGATCVGCGPGTPGTLVYAIVGHAQRIRLQLCRRN